MRTARVAGDAGEVGEVNDGRRDVESEIPDRLSECE